jgi:hypothetical protein
MLQELEELYPWELPLLLGCPRRTIHNWLSGFSHPPFASAKCIWMVWAGLLHPERLRTVWDLITWGRFAPSSENKPNS